MPSTSSKLLYPAGDIQPATKHFGYRRRAFVPTFGATKNKSTLPQRKLSVIGLR
ncbi:MAG TPA: hypothetical protein VK208_23155 [Pyrinomonadaceae bacterium]|nr:hypothetical protein [Pyrinomonadaceae bacterium]